MDESTNNNTPSTQQTQTPATLNQQENVWHGKYYEIPRYSEENPCSAEKGRTIENVCSERELKRKISAAHTVPSVNMLVSIVLTVVFPIFVMWLYSVICSMSGATPNESGYSDFVNHFFGSETIEGQLANMAIYLVMLSIGPLAYWLLNCRTRFTELIGCKKASFSKYVTCFVAAVSASAIVNYFISIISYFASSLGIELSPPDFNQPETGGSLITLLLFFISMSVLPAFFEEFAYRGFFIGKIRKKAPAAALVASSICFGVMHGNAIQIPGAIAFGLVLGYFVIRYDCIWIGVVAHFVNNLVATAISVLEPAVGSVIISVADRVFTVIVFAAALITVPLFLIKNGIKFSSGEECMPAKKTVRLLFTSAGFWIMLAIAAVNFAFSNFGEQIVSLIYGG